MRIALVSDAWAPQVNGVVRTLEALEAELGRMGHRVVAIQPGDFRSMPCPTYPEIRLALAGRGAVGARIEAAMPDAIHIATEGPLGLAARRYCLRRGWPFTTAYHTHFPDYVARRWPVPAGAVWPLVRRFHAPSAAVMVSTPSVARQLEAHGVARVRRWGRGVDLAAFRTDAPPHPRMAGLPRPIQLYVGRVAVEKNIEAFLATDHPGSKVVVGDGPSRAELARRFPRAGFLGSLSGEALAGAYAAADVFVFPSRTDTFGLVLIEALASGLPVAAYPVTGPIDVVAPHVGCLDPDLGTAIGGALAKDRAACREYAAGFSWEESARQFLAALAPLRQERRAAA